jgi:hypothetical protein
MAGVRISSTYAEYLPGVTLSSLRRDMLSNPFCLLQGPQNLLRYASWSSYAVPLFLHCLGLFPQDVQDLFKFGYEQITIEMMKMRVPGMNARTEPRGGDTSESYFVYCIP